MIGYLRARYNELAAEVAQSKAEYAQLEQILLDKRRSIDMDMGALRELERLIEVCDDRPALIASVNGTHD